MMSCRVVCVSERVKEAFQDGHMTVLIKVARRLTRLASLPDQATLEIHTRCTVVSNLEPQKRFNLGYEATIHLYSVQHNFSNYRMHAILEITKYHNIGQLNSDRSFTLWLLHELT